MGCVEKKLIVRTDPPGAEVWLDGRFQGRTAPSEPVEVSFEFYGTRTLEARLPGYHPLETLVELEAPYYQVFPLDFVSDLLWPGTIEDVHEPPPFELAPRPELPDQARDRETSDSKGTLEERARWLRTQGSRRR